MSESDKTAQLRLSVAATFVAEPLEKGLSLVLKEAGFRDSEIRFAPYHQIFQELLSGNSLISSGDSDVKILLIRLSDFVRDCKDLDSGVTLLQRTKGELCQALSHFAEHDSSGAPTLISFLESSGSNAIAGLDVELEQALEAVLEHVQLLPNLKLLTKSEIESVAEGNIFDEVRDRLGHIPYTEAYYGSIALALGRKIHSLKAAPHKVLVLDCDNTIWGGVVGEVGPEGIELKPEHIAIQRFAVEQKAKGVLICLASKNVEADVLEVFNTRQDMVLKLEHLIANKINWIPKTENIRALAEQLNLGLDSFVFIDDNPVECMQMETELPQVVTLQFPTVDVEQFLSNLWVFDKNSITGEDSRRTELYRENSHRQAAEASSSSLEEFVDSLDLSVEVSAVSDEEFERVSQLTQRTNQFNLTTVRRSEGDIRALQGSGFQILKVLVKDRFGDYGLVGVAILRKLDQELFIDTFLLSCRVLGRGVEFAVVREIGKIADELSCVSLKFPFLPSPKNEPARIFLESLPFDDLTEDSGRKIYQISTSASLTVKAILNKAPTSSKKVKKTDRSSNDLVVRSRSKIYDRLSKELNSGARVQECLSAMNRERNLSTPLVKPTSETEKKLVAIWERHLGVNNIGIDDVFFELGGTSLQAVGLFADVSKELNCSLPVSTIVEFPTVRNLAARLTATDATPENVLVRLSEGAGPNMFLIHDGDGEVLLYMNLAKRLDGASVYGVKPLAKNGMSMAHTSIESMAEFYTKAIRDFQPEGPYMLGGLCAGGVLAYEIARQLMARNQKVTFAMVLDAAVPGAARKPSGRIGRVSDTLALLKERDKSFLYRYFNVCSILINKLFSTLTWLVREKVNSVNTKFRFALLDYLSLNGLAWPKAFRPLTVRQTYDSAEARYSPPPSDVNVVLVRAQGIDSGELEPGDTPYANLYMDDDLGWSSVTTNLEVYDTPGGHGGMLQEAWVDGLVEILTPIISGSTPGFGSPYEKNKS